MPNSSSSTVSSKTLGLFAIGNALVDQEFYLKDDAILHAHTIAKGTTQLASLEEQHALNHLLQQHYTPQNLSSGGSAANTAFAFAALGGTAHYACRVGTDAQGAFYLKDLEKAGVETSPLAQTEGNTGTCIVMVSPDAQRTMQTCLGISAALEISQVNTLALQNSHFLYIEGYLATNPHAVEAVQQLKQLARQSNTLIAATLSDPAMVQYARSGLDALLDGGVDVLFCNQDEAMAYTLQSSINDAAEHLLRIAPHVVITASEQGVFIFTHNQTPLHILGESVANVLNTNGAGDAFAGSYLYALWAGHSTQHAARLANKIAAHVIQHTGARLPHTHYAPLLHNAFSA